LRIGHYGIQLFTITISQSTWQEELIIVVATGLEGKTAFITGSAKGLGKMTALTLAQLGCNVAINYNHSKVEAEALRERISALGVQAVALQGNVASAADVKAMIHLAEEMVGPIDILINNAGPFIRERKCFADYEENELDELVQGNLLGVMRLDRCVVQGMRARGWGRIIHFGFGRAFEARGWPHRAVYAAAKIGLVSFTKSLAVEEAPFGITVNMICPGDIRGDAKEMTISEVTGRNDHESPHQRPGTGEDVARVIAFLCQPASDYVTGNIIDVSGGFDPIRNHIYS
jgi:3-oxoacyl-[acyl-carrier protein] reductase